MKNEFEGLVGRLLGANVSLEDATEILERSMIEGALARHRGNQSAASKQLGIHRNTLQRKVVEYELKRKPAVREARGRRQRTGTM
jgi:Fis family transcriptional regulator, factor for inversion stimulation protein